MRRRNLIERAAQRRWAYACITQDQNILGKRQEPTCPLYNLQIDLPMPGGSRIVVPSIMR